MRQIRDQLKEKKVLIEMSVADDSWLLLKRLAKEFKLTHAEIGRNVGSASEMVNRILNGDLRYVKNVRYSKYHASIRIAEYVLKFVEDRLDSVEDLLYGIEQFQLSATPDGKATLEEEVTKKENPRPEDTAGVEPAR